MSMSDLTRLPGAVHVTTGCCAPCTDGEHATVEDGVCLCCGKESE
jgi:hypothetical protein